MFRKMVMPNGKYSDRAFIDAMVPHQEGAVEMAKVALKHAEYPEIKKLAGEGKTPVFVAVGGRLVGLVAVADTVRQESKEAVERLHALGLEVAMLTGDNRRTAEAIAGSSASTGCSRGPTSA